MKNIFYVFIIVLFLSFFSIAVIRKGSRILVNTFFNQTDDQITISPKYELGLPTSYDTQYGLMLAGKNISKTNSIAIAKNLGVTFFRSDAIRISTWNGTCDMCDKITAAGLKSLPSISNSGGTGQSSFPPTDMTKYKTTLNQILQKYPFEIVIVENEENSELFYAGTPQQYGEELQAACDVSHALKLKCTNGGLVSKLVALLVYDDYLSKGELNKAQDFAKRVFTDQEQKLFKSQKIVDQLKKGKQLLVEYKKSRADYVNFHWYIDDVQAMKEAVLYLSSQTGLPVISNEIGQQQNENPQQVINILTSVKELKLPLAIWFSIDISGYAQARGLIDQNGNLRPNGIAFQEFMKSVAY